MARPTPHTPHAYKSAPAVALCRGVYSSSAEMYDSTAVQYEEADVSWCTVL